MFCKAKAVAYTTVSAKVIRANGTVEDLGIIADTRRSSWWQRLKKFLIGG